MTSLKRLKDAKGWKDAQCLRMLKAVSDRPGTDPARFRPCWSSSWIVNEEVQHSTTPPFDDGALERHLRLCEVENHLHTWSCNLAQDHWKQPAGSLLVWVLRSTFEWVWRRLTSMPAENSCTTEMPNNHVSSATAPVSNCLIQKCQHIRHIRTSCEVLSLSKCVNKTPH